MKLNLKIENRVLGTLLSIEIFVVVVSFVENVEHDANERLSSRVVRPAFVSQARSLLETARNSAIFLLHIQ